MQIRLKDVKDIFEQVLAESMSRDKADRWAYAAIQAEESGNLHLAPPEDQERIWKGIMYLYGIDMMESPSVYLHSVEDIRNAFLEICNC